MLKRKRLNDNESGGESMYVFPPLESTALIDTGSIETGNECIGRIQSIGVNASLSSGTQLFEYNHFFWSKDIFTFNYASCAVFIAIAFYQNSQAYFALYPIFLPRVALATWQSLQNNPTTNPTVRKWLIDDLLYYLNGAFTSFNYDTLPPGSQFVGIPPMQVFQGGPSIYTATKKGFLKRPTANNPDFPIFQDNVATGPPLLWVYSSSNNQLALIRNPDFWDVFPRPPGLAEDAAIAFQLVSPEYFFFTGLNNPLNTTVSSIPIVGPSFLINQQYSNLAVPSVCNSSDTNGSSSSSSGATAQRGWCSQGVFSTGFGQRNTSVGSGQARDPNTNVGYTDIYRNSDIRANLFLQTSFPGIDPPIAGVTTSDQFQSFANSNQLVTDCVVAKRMCCLIPSRYIVIESEILSRDQRLFCKSNNPALGSPTIIGVEFLDLDQIRSSKVDGTLSGERKSRSVDSFGDSPVSHKNPSFSIQSLDLSIQDEWRNYLQNFRTPGGYTLQFSSDPTNPPLPFLTNSGNFIFLAIEGEYGGYNNGIFVIPPWLAALNPNTALGNTEPLISPFASYMAQPFFGIAANNRSGLIGAPFQPSIPSDFSPNIPISGNLIHFGRVLGH